MDVSRRSIEMSHNYVKLAPEKKLLTNFTNAEEALNNLVARINPVKQRALELKQQFIGLENSDQFYRQHEDYDNSSVAKAKESLDKLIELEENKVELNIQLEQIFNDFTACDTQFSLTDTPNLDEKVNLLFKEFEESLKDGSAALNYMTPNKFEDLSTSFSVRSVECCVIL